MKKKKTNMEGMKRRRGRRKNSHEGDGEVESLPQASEGDEGLTGEAAGGHLTVGLLVLPRWTLAHEPTRRSVDTHASVSAHTWHAAA